MHEQKDLNEQVAPAVEEWKMKWWQVLWGMIRHPGYTYQLTNGQVCLMVPMLLIMCGSVITGMAVGLTQQKEMAAIGGVLAVMGILIGWVIQSGVLHVVLCALGGKGVFRQALEIVGWAWIPLFFGSLVKGFYSLITANSPMPQGTGLAHAFLANTNLFIIWNMVLLVIGFAVIYGVNKPRVAVGVVGFWLVMVLLTYAGDLLGQTVATSGGGP